MRQTVFGLIGAGGLANSQHLPNLALAPHARVKTVCDLRAAAAEAARTKYRIPNAETDHARVLADEEIEAVVIATKAEAHAALTVEALQAGKHVYVEKPLATSVAECEAVVEAQRRSGRHVAVGFNRRFAPAYRLARKIVAAHGGPWNIHYRIADSYSRTWGRGEKPGQRLFHELCHIFDILRWLTGSEAESVYCVASRADDEVVVCRFASGPVASITSSGYASRDWPKEALEIIAEFGGVTVDNFVELRAYGFDDLPRRTCFAGHVHPDYDYTHRWLYEALGADAMRAVHASTDRLRRIAEGELTADDPAEAALAREYTEHHRPVGNYEVDKGWRQAVDHFAECVAAGRKPENASAHDGLVAERMAAAAAESRWTRQPVAPRL